ncbi:MAG: hypothetical protein NTV88_05410 [Candidatus Micrarchaeota archaeon]|nr:hypothetical protein [Candidatus Micrarchaeota archaeon]
MVFLFDAIYKNKASEAGDSGYLVLKVSQINDLAKKFGASKNLNAAQKSELKSFLDNVFYGLAKNQNISQLPLGTKITIDKEELLENWNSHLHGGFYQPEFIKMMSDATTYFGFGESKKIGAGGMAGGEKSEQGNAFFAAAKKSIPDLEWKKLETAIKNGIKNDELDKDVANAFLKTLKNNGRIDRNGTYTWTSESSFEIEFSLAMPSRIPLEMHGDIVTYYKENYLFSDEFLASNGYAADKLYLNPNAIDNAVKSYYRKALSSRPTMEKILYENLPKLNIKLQNAKGDADIISALLSFRDNVQQDVLSRVQANGVAMEFINVLNYEMTKGDFSDDRNKGKTIKSSVSGEGNKEILSIKIVAN